ncbi:glycosyltransferase family 2 protein [Brevundimonas sp.]|uniref:glycosyltransferase family 2 protein n=1 Tax=Brevundimonas sp. TaxID=1871086 RepID=UPI003BAC4FCF
MTGLSVLTLVKNRALHLDRLIEGLDRSAYRPLELIIVDMSDEPVEPRSRGGFPTTTVPLAAEGLPLAAARNLAAERARGDRLLFLDVDCIPTTGLAGRMDEALRDEDALVCAEVRYLAADAVHEDWTETGLAEAARPHPVRDFPTSGRRYETNAGLFWSLTFGIRRDTFARVGGFDEGFEGYGAEDTDFGFRCREAGLPLVFIGGPGSFHQHHGVYDPPLQHFEPILENARRFRQRWGFWPMEGWLKAFAERGLVGFDGATLERLRAPTPQEIQNARKTGDARF